jgi:alpha-mannosidase
VNPERLAEKLGRAQAVDALQENAEQHGHPADVLVAALRPSDDGKAWMVRLFGADATPATARLAWAEPAPKHLWLSDTNERPARKFSGDIPVPVSGLITIRAELP